MGYLLVLAVSIGLTLIPVAWMTVRELKEIRKERNEKKILSRY